MGSDQSMAERHPQEAASSESGVSTPVASISSMYERAARKAGTVR